MPIKTPLVTPFVSIRNFGAVPDDPRRTVRLANSEAFKQAQATMKSDPFAFGHPLFVPSGTFYLADDLHIGKSLELFGTGMLGESILMFPAIFGITDEALERLVGAAVPDEAVAILRDLLGQEFMNAEELIGTVGELLGPDMTSTYRSEILKCAFIRGTSLVIDPGSELDPALTGSNCSIRDLQIVSEENWTTDEVSPFDSENFEPPTFEGTCKGTPGIKMSSPATIQRAYIKGFSGTGIYVIAPGGYLNANQWRIHDVYIDTCGGHGVHIDGGEAQGGLCTGAKIIVVGGTGIFESSFCGNTYVGCYVEVAKGRGYASDSVGQSTFVGCVAEANEPVRLSAGGNVWVGGGPGAGFTADTSAFIVEGYANVHPFVVPNLAEPQIKQYVGYPNDATDPTTVSAWENDNGEFFVLRWDMGNKIWATENGAIVPEMDVNGQFLGLRELPARNVASYLTGSGHPRGPWLQGFGEVLLGPADGPVKISRGDRPADGTGEPGDIVYKANPEVGDYIGYVCLAPAREWKPFGKIEA